MTAASDAWIARQSLSGHRLRLVRSVFRWSLLLVAVTLAMSWYGPPRHADHLPQGWNSPILAFELAHSAGDALQVVASPGMESRMRRHLWIDFLFLTGYAAVFLRLGQLTASRGCKACIWIGRAAVAAALVTALADIAENYGMLQVLAQRDEWAAFMRTASLIKWAAFGSTCLLTASLFIPRLPVDSLDRVAAGLIALLFLAASFASLWAVFVRELALEAALPPVLAAFAAQFLLLWRRPQSFVDSL